MTIDWRGEICRFLGKPSGLTDDEILDALEATSDHIKEMKRLKTSEFAQPNPPRFQVIHQIHCAAFKDESGLYEDPPWVVESGPYMAHLRGSHSIRNFDLYLEQNKEITFIVYLQFECCGKAPPTDDATNNRARRELSPDDLLVGEYVSIISEELRSAFVELSESALSGIIHPDFDADSGDQISSPYLWWFHRRAEIETAKSQLGPSFQRQLSVFQEYLESSLGDEWEAVESLLGRKRIIAEYLDYLFARALADVSGSHKCSMLTASRFRMNYASRSGKAIAQR
ncbi:hypothetical protein DL767_004629 [Monosporascus sp. MG133]|nr:hypothetical protein DL767_004629 [Monosporascus sp. MG133]